METQIRSQTIALDTFRKQGGLLRTGEALRLGIHPRTLYALHNAGRIVRLSRGLYRLADMPPLIAPDLIIVARRLPDAVICLVSALAFHDLTTQIPGTVDIAIKKGSQRPKLDNPPLRVFWFSDLAWTQGVETHSLDGCPIRVYSVEKSVADCFKFRNKIGMDIALEALRLARRRSDFQLDQLIYFARIDRVFRVMEPYLESLF